MFLALNYCSGIFWKFVSYLYMWWCAQTFLPIFGHFTIFDHNFTVFVDVSDKQEAQVMLITGFHDLEMGVKGHSRSLRVVSFNRLCMVSY